MEQGMRIAIFSMAAFRIGFSGMGALGVQCQQLKRNWHLPRKKIK